MDWIELNWIGEEFNELDKNSFTVQLKKKKTKLERNTKTLIR